jgi:hypothetical protein
MTLSRSTGLKRTGFTRSERKEASAVKKLRQKKCAVKTCRAPFTPERPFIKWCSPECGAVVAVALVAIRKAKAARADRAETKKKLEAFKSIPHLKAELQTIFNEYIRLRDDELPCICCDKWPKGGAALCGGQWDAAHWKGRGAADHLRFNEDNVHKALKDCNEFGHTDYRGGLVRKIGLARVEALESDHALVKWTREWLEEKKTEYRAKIKQLKGK